MTETKRVDIRCPACDSFIVNAPEDNLPVGDLVCPNCSAVLEAPTALDKFVAKMKTTVKNAVSGSGEDDNPG